MVLEELNLASWIGFITGTLFIRPPWGTIYVKSFRNPAFVYHLFLSIICLFLWFDFIIHYKTSEDKILVRRVVTISLSWGVIILKEFVRLGLSLKSDKYGNFFRKLESHYDIVSSLNPHPNPVSKIDKLVLLFCLFMQTITGCAVSYIFYSRRNENIVNSWLDSWGNWQYSLTFFTFAAMPNYLLIYITFAHVLISTRYLMYIFMDFCKQVALALETGQGELPKITHAIYEREICRRNVKSSSSAEFLKANLLRQFDEIMILFKMYDEVIGMLVFGVVALTVTQCILKINDMLSWTSVFSVMFYDAVSLCVEIIQLYAIVLVLGTYTAVNMRKEKDKLKKMIVSLPNSNLKTHLNDVVGLLYHWNWQMSAMGIFNIGRPLMAGVVFLLMSYAAIVFQVQISPLGF